MKDQIINYIKQLREQTAEATADPLKAYVELKAIEKELKTALTEVSEPAVNEAYNYGDKSFKAFGAEVTVKSSPGRWSFDHLPKIKEIKTGLKELEKAHKEAYKMSLKGQTMVVEGDVIVEPAKFTAGKDILSIKI